MNKALIITAPSGAGKTTLVKMLLAEFNNFKFSVSACTRKPREFEEHGKDYYFLSKEIFEEKVRQDEFLEWEEVYEDMYYGTLKSEVERIWEEGNVVIFDIDVKGALHLKKKLGKQALSVFIKTPTVEELTNRLKKRGTETEASLQKRVTRYKEELLLADAFDNILINDDLEGAYGELKEMVLEFI